MGPTNKLCQYIKDNPDLLAACKARLAQEPPVSPKVALGFALLKQRNTPRDVMEAIRDMPNWNAVAKFASEYVPEAPQ